METSIVRKFRNEYSGLLCRSGSIVRGLYIRSDCSELFIFEHKEWKGQRRTFVFEFGCGYLEELRTEVNTMEKYLLEIPKCDLAEYITF